MKKIHMSNYILLGIGIISVLAGVVISLVTCILYTDRFGSGSTGIIGGAGTPTFILIMQCVFGGFALYLFVWGFTFLISAICGRLLHTTIAKRCTKRTTAASLGISCTATVGFCCLFVWRGILAMGIGLLSLAALVFLVALYCKMRKGSFSVKGLLLDIAVCFLYMPSFLCLCSAVGSLF